MSIPEGCEAIGSSLRKKCPGCCFGRRFQHLGIQTLGSETRIGQNTACLKMKQRGRNENWLHNAMYNSTHEYM